MEAERTGPDQTRPGTVDGGPEPDVVQHGLNRTEPAGISSCVMGEPAERDGKQADDVYRGAAGGLPGDGRIEPNRAGESRTERNTTTDMRRAGVSVADWLSSLILLLLFCL